MTDCAAQSNILWTLVFDACKWSYKATVNPLNSNRTLGNEWLCAFKAVKTVVEGWDHHILLLQYYFTWRLTRWVHSSREESCSWVRERETRCCCDLTLRTRRCCHSCTSCSAPCFSCWGWGRSTENHWWWGRVTEMESDTSSLGWETVDHWTWSHPPPCSWSCVSEMMFQCALCHISAVETLWLQDWWWGWRETRPGQRSLHHRLRNWCGAWTWDCDLDRDLPHSSAESDDPRTQWSCSGAGHSQSRSTPCSRGAAWSPCWRGSRAPRSSSCVSACPRPGPGHACCGRSHWTRSQDSSGSASHWCWSCWRCWSRSRSPCPSCDPRHWSWIFLMMIWRRCQDCSDCIHHCHHPQDYSPPWYHPDQDTCDSDSCSCCSLVDSCSCWTLVYDCYSSLKLAVVHYFSVQNEQFCQQLFCCQEPLESASFLQQFCSLIANVL